MSIIRSWREQKILLKRQFPFLSDVDFDFEEGTKDTMLMALAKKLQITSMELDRLFADLQKQ